ncbi:hypothetical protein D3C87_451800 [compost metagenome]
MALSPLRKQEERFILLKPQPRASRTYALDFDSGEITGRMIEGVEALRQFIRKAIITARYRYLIYNGQYGCELDSLLGQDISQELLKSEITRVITEALSYDDRIEGVSRFQVVRRADELYVTFMVQTREGLIEQEVTI